MLEHLREELEEFLEQTKNASEARLPHVVRAKADTILAFMEGFGMAPPHHPTKGYEQVIVNPTGTHDYGRKKLREWEEE